VATLANSSLLLMGFDSFSALLPRRLSLTECRAEATSGSRRRRRSECFTKDGLGQHRSGGRAVPGGVIGFDRTSRTICAPMFSYLSFRSISRATVTPSLVTTGEPYFLPMTTLRPRSQGHPHRIRERVHALEDCVPRIFTELQFFRCHFSFSS